MALVSRLTDTQYRYRPNETVAAVGSHIRHCIDFYTAFMSGVETGRVDYDHRERDPLTAQNPGHAVERLRAIATYLHELPVGDDYLLLTRLDSSHPAQDAGAWGESSVRRELQFLVSHTIHHYALIALLLRWQGIEPGAEFGVAPSTLAHWRGTQ